MTQLTTSLTTASVFLAVLAAGMANAAPQALHVQPNWAKAKSANSAEALEQHPERFATPVPVSYSSQSHGEWTSASDGQAQTSTWTLTITIDGATSASFAARNVRLPSGAHLAITGQDGVARDMPADWVQGGKLWSAIVPGDTMSLTATMPQASAGEFNLEIYEVQAGFRSVSETPISPTVSAKSDVMGSLTAAAIEPKAVGDVIPYTCKLPGGDRSTAEVFVGNLTQCTGTLINSSSGLVKPYLITAGHCDGGDVEPTADRLRELSPSIRVTFHYISSCDGLTQGVTQDTQRVGAVYRGSGQDLWMVELTHGVPANTVFEAFDARNIVPADGGYTVHHGSGKPQQYISTTSYEAYTQPGDYPGIFWVANLEVEGSGSGGASGSSLRVGEKHAAIGTAFNVDGYSPLFYAWDSVGEFLGPQMISTAVEGDSLPAPTLTLKVSNAAPTAGADVTVSWTSQNAFTCVPVSAWADTVETSGSATVKAPASGTMAYQMTCYGAGKNAAQTVSVNVGGNTGGGGGTTGGSNSDDDKGGSGGGPMGGTSLICLGLATLIRRFKARSTQRSLNIAIRSANQLIGYVGVNRFS